MTKRRIIPPECYSHRQAEQLVEAMRGEIADLRAEVSILKSANALRNAAA